MGGCEGGERKSGSKARTQNGQKTQKKGVLGPEANLERTCHFAFSSFSPIGY